MKKISAIIIVVFMLAPIYIWSDEALQIKLAPERQDLPFRDTTIKSNVREFFTPTDMNININPPEGVAKYSFAQERLMQTGSQQGFGLRSTSSTELQFSPLKRTKFRLSKTANKTERLDESLTKNHEVTEMGIEQDFHFGTMGFLQVLEANTNQNGITRTDQTQKFNLDVKASQRLRFASTFTTQKSSSELGPTGQAWSMKFDANIDGEAAVLAIDDAKFLQGDRKTTKKDRKLTLPLHLFGSDISLVHRKQKMDVNGQPSSIDNIDDISIPFSLFGEAASFDMTQTEKLTPRINKTTKKMDIMLPIRVDEHILDVQRHIHNETKNGNVQESDITTFTLPIPIRDRMGTMTYTDSETLKSGRSRDAQEWALQLPFCIGDHDYLIQRHQTDADIDGKRIDSITMELSGPIHIIDGSTANYQTTNRTINGLRSNSEILRIILPTDTIGSVSLTREDHQGKMTKRSNKIVEIDMPMLGQNLHLKRAITTTRNTSTTKKEMITKATSPKISLLSGIANITARMMRQETDDVPRRKTTGIDFTVAPSTSIGIRGTIEDVDLGHQERSRSHKITGTYELSHNTSCGIRISDTDGSGKPTSDRRLIITAKPGDAEVSGSIISWVANGRQRQLSKIASISIDGEGMSILAEYKGAGFDKKGKIFDLPSPTVKLELEMGGSDEKSLRFRYIDEEKRTDAECGLQMRFAGLDGNVMLGYTENSTDPRNPKKTRSAKAYDFTIDRTVFGNVGMQLGIRHYIPSKSADAKNFNSLELSGGDLNGGGEIRISATSGDFVKRKHDGVFPNSILSIDFRRQVKNGVLELMIRRVSGTDTKETRGMLTYSTSF